MKSRVILINSHKVESEDFLANVARVSTGYSFREENDNYFWGNANEKLLLTLCKLRHESVFEFAGVCYWIECPIFVARQLMRYRCASYIERSGRRTEPLDMSRPDSDAPQIEHDAWDCYRTSVENYKELVEAGASKEEARRVLTLEEPTQYLFKCNLRELIHIFDERLRPDAQKETRELVTKMFILAKQELFPTILGYYQENNNWALA